MIGQQIRELRELCMLKIKTVNIEYKYHYRLTIKSEKTRRRSLQYDPLQTVIFLSQSRLRHKKHKENGISSFSASVSGSSSHERLLGCCVWLCRMLM